MTEDGAEGPARELLETCRELLDRSDRHLSRARRSWRLTARAEELGRARGLKDAVETLQDLVERWLSETEEGARDG